ncbi:MAG: DNA recombination protein RmuC [Halieaceae bacterium]|nr:DNA recombination protein RmuC [Halieaceae bacterium]
MNDYSLTLELSTLILGGALWTTLLVSALVAKFGRYRTAERLLTEKLSDLEVQLKRHSDRAREAEISREELLQSLAAKTAQCEALQMAHQSIQTETERVRTEMSSEFRLLAQQILEEKSAKLQEGSADALGKTLIPLHHQLKDFRAKIEDVHEKQLRDRATLQAELEQIKQLNRRLSEDADNLAKALKGDKKLQGNWGEIVLEQILEHSGLRKGFEYQTQVALRDESGQRRLPDVIVNLPDKRHIVIDSKVSLVAYSQAMGATEQAEREAALKVHIKSVANHIDALASKNYELLDGLQTLDFVLLFIPIESAFIAAFESEPELFKRAYDKSVIVVSPSTLLATLKTVQTVWRYEQQNRNAERIAEQAGRLFDQTILVLESILDVEKHVNKANESLQQTKARLNTNKGSLVSRIGALSELGARHKKQIPAEFNEQGGFDRIGTTLDNIDDVFTEGVDK